MVRTLLGTMLEVAGGMRDLTEFDRLLSGGKRSEAGPAVSSRGLTLVGVGYDEPNLWRGER
jgi:tRNA U38,U39,U40 pseudouridine synthase TruA